MPQIKLRQDTVRTLAFIGRHAKQQCIYWDATLPTFGVRVCHGGRRTYVCSYRIRKRKRLAKLGSVTVLSLDQARKKARSFLGSVADGEDPQPTADPLPKAEYVEELCETYVERHAKKKKITWRDDESTLKRYIVAKLRGRLAASITSADIEPIHADVGTEHPYAANRILKVYRKMVNWAKVAGLLPRDYASPVMDIIRFREITRKRYLTTEEMPRFLHALEQEDNEYARHAIWLLLLTGLRCKELLKAKWMDIDWSAGTLYIGHTKNGEPLLAPLSAAAVHRLQAIPRIEGNPHVFCGRKLAGHLTTLTDPVKRTLERASVAGVRTHDIRRTVGSWLAQEGHSLHLIGTVLNHKDPKTTAGYAYFQTKQRRDALDGHAEKVLALGPELVLTEPQPIVAEALLPALDSEPACTSISAPVRQRHYFKREAPFELVWTAPVYEVAARLGVSDMAVAKLCRRADIPLPPRGYWQRLEAGQCIARPSLPVAPPGLPPLLRIRATHPLELIPPSACS
jgi:integrase